MFYHAHFYYDRTEEAEAKAIRAACEDHFGARLRVGPLFNMPIGPHPVPMFEIDCHEVTLNELKSWLKENRAGHSVLIHPNTGDDLKDHTEHATWLGKPLSLRLERL